MSGKQAITQPSGTLDDPELSPREARKRDALAFAELVYDIYKEDLASGKIPNGQINAIQFTSD